MEIFASHVRTTQAASASDVLRHDLADLLRPGRVLAGVVLENRPGQVLLGIGRHRVLADSSRELPPGRHLLLRVGEGSGGVLLDVLGRGGAGESALLRSLRAVLGEDRPIGRLLAELAARLTGARESGARDTAAREGGARRLAESIASHVFRPGSGGEALRGLLERSGLGYEAAILAARARGAARSEPSALHADLKATLLAELGKLPEGPLREAVSRALAGVEAEQLLNLARREAGEPLHLSFPVPDGAQWTTAHVFVHPRDDGADGEDAEAEGRSSRHVSVGVELGNTGPVRIDLWMGSKEISVRLSVEREEVAARVRADLEELTGALERETAEAGGPAAPAGGRPVRIVVGVAPAEVVELERRAADVRYLREHHLMDVSG